MAEPEIRYATTADGVAVAYYTTGEGLPLLVTSNVLWGHLRLQPVREYHRSRSGHGLGRGLQIIRYDARGTGLSDRGALDFTMPARLLDMEAVVERLGLQRFAIFGVGHGTLSAIAYAADHPQHVSHLVLADPYVRGLDFRTYARRWDSLTDESDEDWDRYTLTMATLDTDFSNPELARKLSEIFREAMTLQGLRGFLEALNDLDVASALDRITVPTLVLHRDAPANPFKIEWAREVVSRIRDASLIMLPAGTYPAWTDQQTSTVEDFLGLSPEQLAPAREGVVSSRGRTASASTTILCTDMAGNTDILQRLGDDAWRSVLRDHERITREMLRTHGGTEVKTMGDGFLASFDSATRALQSAVDLQRAFATRNALADEQISVRVGLNAGEPIEEDDDLFGTAVTMASRIMGHAAGGQILVSDVVRGLVAGKGFAFVECAEFVPKGFDAAIRPFEVRWRE